MSNVEDLFNSALSSIMNTRAVCNISSKTCLNYLPTAREGNVFTGGRGGWVSLFPGSFQSLVPYILSGEVSLITGSFHVLVPCPFGWVGYGGLVVAFWHIWSSSTGLLAFASWTGPSGICLLGLA